MRVSIKDNVYGMSRREYKKLLNIASNAMLPFSTVYMLLKKVT